MKNAKRTRIRTGIKTTAVRRGRPFSNGPDPRRNRKGRTAKPRKSPAEVMLDVIMTEVGVTVGGRRLKRPKIAVVLEQQLGPALQGDQSAARTAATLIRAIDGLIRPPKDAADITPASVHDANKLAAIMKEYDTRLTKAVKKKSAE